MFQSLHKEVQKSFVTESPPHLVGNGQSSVHIIQESSWSGMSSAKVQKKLKTGVVLIKPDVDNNISFDRELFVNMLGHGNMKYVVPMEGESLYSMKLFISEKFYIKTNLLLRKGGSFI